MLGNTASPTVLRAGSKTNVIPNYAEAEIDGRTVPGQTTADILRELQEVLGPEVMHDLPPVVEERTELYDTVVDVMGRRAPTSPVVPYMLPGFTDAKAFTGRGRHPHRQALNAVMDHGATPAREQPEGWEFKGFNPPTFAKVLGFQRFVKGFFVDDGGKLAGYNLFVHSARSGPKAAWRPKKDGAPEARHGF